MNQNLGNALLVIARNAITEAIGASRYTQAIPEFDPEIMDMLMQPGAVFVTLTIDGDLRGCVGSLRAHRSLLDDCFENAIAAALHDTRFLPVTSLELKLIRIEVSVLSTAEPFPCADEADACARLIPREQGVILNCHGHCATFLPQVWEQLPDPRDFLSALKHKAGLPHEFWDHSLHLSVYHVEHVEEAGG